MAAKKEHSTEPCSLGTMEDVQQIFNTFDKNRDGKISRAELKDVLKALGSETSAEELTRIMAEIDSDGDGFIDVHEFAEFHRTGAGIDGKPSAAENGSSSKELRDAFDLYDVDKNGLISAKELHSVLRRLGENCTLGDCSKMIRSVDADGDGSVNFEEFKKMMSRA